MQTSAEMTRVQANGWGRREHSRATTAVSSTRGATTYYDRPMIKRPTWRWFIPLYFFLGGVAGGAAVIGAAAALLGGVRHRSTVRHARYLSLALAPLCALLLILDLGRPARFHHMLRVFKGSSPLSVGTWILTTFGLTSGVLAARQAVEDDFILRRRSLLGRVARLVPSRPLSAVHGLLGLAIGGYTGVLLGATAVPLWAAAGVLLGPLFLATSLASGAAALRLLAILVEAPPGADAGTDADIERVELVATMTQLGLVGARRALVPARSATPLRRGRWGWLWRLGAVGGGMVGPLTVSVLARLTGPRVHARLKTVSASLTLAGALAERVALIEAGKRSADDPLAYQELTRGAPGTARPTPTEQAQRAPAQTRTQPYQPHQVVPAP